MTGANRIKLIAGLVAQLIICTNAASAIYPQSQSQERSSAATIAPPRADLLPVHLPDTKRLEATVGEQLASFQESLVAATKDPKITLSKLGEAYGLMGQVYLAYQLMPPAKECFQNAHYLMPADFRWPYFLGYIQQQEGRAEQAVDYYRQARRLRSNYLPAMVSLAGIYLQQNRLDEARALFNEALATGGNCAACRYGLGQVALSNRDYKGAIEQLEKALAEAPEANRIHYALAMAYRGLGEIEKARAHLERQGAVGVKVADPLVDELQQLVRGERLHMIRGRMAFDARRFSEAADEYRKAVQANSASVPARVNLGSALAQAGDIGGAIEQFEQAIKLDRNNVAAHYNLAVLLAKRNEHEKAISSFQAVLGASPEDLEARFLLAQELLKAGHAAAALEEFSRVVEADPGNEEALLEMVNLLLINKSYGAAIEKLNRAHALFPQNGRTAATLAFLLAASPQQNLRNGARALEMARLIYKSTGSPNHGAIVAMALAELDRCDEAARWQQQMISDAEKGGNKELAEKLKADFERYKKGQPCRPAGDAPDTTRPQENKKP